MAQRIVSGSDCVAVDATISYYFDGSVADRVHREIIGKNLTHLQTLLLFKDSLSLQELVVEVAKRQRVAD